MWLENKPTEPELFKKPLGDTEIKRPREREWERENGMEGGSTQWALVGSQCSHVANPLVFPKAGNTDHCGAEGRAGVCLVCLNLNYKVLIYLHTQKMYTL